MNAFGHHHGIIFPFALATIVPWIGCGAPDEVQTMGVLQAKRPYDNVHLFAV